MALDAAAADLTEDRRFPFCTREGLMDLTRQAGLGTVELTAIESPTVFRDFEDYWRPFTLGAGPAPGYCASLSSEDRALERQVVRQPAAAAGWLDPPQHESLGPEGARELRLHWFSPAPSARNG